jgi:hypothetical protein
MQTDCKRAPDNWTSQTDTVAAGRAANCLQITYFPVHRGTGCHGGAITSDRAFMARLSAPRLRLRPMREPSCKRIAKHGSATGAISDELVPRHPSAPPLDRHRACAPEASCERNALGGSGSLQCPEQDVLSGAEVQERLALQTEAEWGDHRVG